MLPSADTLNEFEHGKFVLSNLAAKRAKQLRDGAPPLVQVDSHHPLTIALAEIAAGKIKAIMPQADDKDAIEGAGMTLISDETLPAELGMLLPALDETEVALVSPVAGLVEEELEADAESEEPHDELSLSDLVTGEEEEEPAAPASDDETLSLSDIAEQEDTAADEEESDI